MKWFSTDGAVNFPCDVQWLAQVEALLDWPQVSPGGGDGGQTIGRILLRSALFHLCTHVLLRFWNRGGHRGSHLLLAPDGGGMQSRSTCSRSRTPSLLCSTTQNKSPTGKDHVGVHSIIVLLLNVVEIAIFRPVLA